MYRNSKYAFKIDSGTLEDLLPLAICLLPSRKEKHRRFCKGLWFKRSNQAWAIYGFTLAYKYTKDKRFLKTAENLARYFIRNLPEDYVPYWDFDDTKRKVRDSSAAAIASSGLLTLSELSFKEEFREVAINILNSLCAGYLSVEDEDETLKHGCFYKPAGIGVDESLIWGDYYFIEAIMKMI
jgi:unsaturated chondroitin disaccharide hydrolase